MKTWKKFVALILSLLCIISSCPYASAAESTGELGEDGYIYYDHSSEHVLSPEEAAAYSCFEVSTQQDAGVAAMNELSTKDYILSLASLSSEYTISGLDIKTYESDTLQNSLYECDQIGEIIQIEDVLYITYFTTSGIEVRVGYDSAGLTEKIIYYPESDTAIIQNHESFIQFDGFRAGCSSVISDSLLAEIDGYIQDENWDALDNLDCISWELNPESADSPSTRSGGVMGFTNDAAMLQDLKNDFTMKYDSIIYQQSMYSSLISNSFTVKVLEDRNGYVRLTSSFDFFDAYSAVSTIGGALGLLLAPTLEILAVLNVAVGVYNGITSILEDVKLYYSARYRYLGARDGYVLDTITYNDYVHVIYHSGYGEFTGGYASNGVFTWVESLRSSAFTHTESSIAQNALENYAKNIYADGYCSMYWPD